MSGFNRRDTKRPGIAALGSLVPFGLLTSVVAYQGQLLVDVGWRGGEYARTFIGVAVGAILLGSVLRPFLSQPWESIGSGMLAAGTLGVVITVALLVVFVIAMSQSDLLP
jgi:hypothetical protein